MSAYESYGKTVEEAISEGLSKMGLSLGEVQVEILDEGSKGLFGLFGSKQAKVRLTAKQDEGNRDTASIFAGSLDRYDAASRAQPKPAAPSTPKPEKPAKPAAEQQPAADKPPAAERPPRAPRRRKESQPRQAEEGQAPRAPRAPRPPREPAVRKPLVPAEPRDPATDEGKVQVFIQRITELMGLEVSVSVNSDEEGNIRVVIEGDSLGILIGRRGETLDALQYLTALHLNRGREGYTRVTLDSEGYRAKREDALIRLANRMANRAQKTGRRVSMEPMNPYERRILHSALQHHPGIATHSEGEEPNRHVVITLSEAEKSEGEGAEK